MALFFISNKIVRNSLFTVSLNYQKEQFKKTLIIFLNLFNPILNLEKYDKIGIIDNTINYNHDEYNLIDTKKFTFEFYLDKYKFYQSISRWYYCQKREQIFLNLDIVFNEYIFVLNKLKTIDQLFIDSFIEIKADYLNLNKNIITKLTLLKETYNDEFINNKVDNYIQSLNKIF